MTYRILKYDLRLLYIKPFDVTWEKMNIPKLKDDAMEFD